MRPREREPPPSASVPSLPRAKGGLSSMVVCPLPAQEKDSDAAGAAGAADSAAAAGAADSAAATGAADSAAAAGAADSAAADNDNNRNDNGSGSNRRRRRRESPPPPSHHRRREYSSSPGRRRGGGSMQVLRRIRDPSPGGFHGSPPPPPFHRRGSPPGRGRRGGSLGFQPRYQRFHDGSGSVSPQQRQRMDDVRHDMVYDNYEPFERGFRDGREGGRFQDVSPRYGVERGGRSSGCGQRSLPPAQGEYAHRNDPERGGRSSGSGQRSLPPAQGEYAQRNDPNSSPREGDWICRNPPCGNLNFSWRTHCSNCHMYRCVPEMHGAIQTHWRGHFHSAPPRRSPPKAADPPIDRSPRRDVDRYGLHPSCWDLEDNREFLPPSGRGRRFDDQVHGERLQYKDDPEYRACRKSALSVPEWDDRYNARDGSISDRRGYVQRTPSPGARWAARERSPPLGDRQLKSSYLKRPRGDRHWDSNLEHVRVADSSVGHGRGYQHSDSLHVRDGGGRGRRVKGSR